MFKWLSGKRDKEDKLRTLRHLFVDLETLELQYKAGMAKHYDAWLWTDAIDKAEAIAGGYPFAIELLKKYKSTFNDFRASVENGSM